MQSELEIFQKQVKKVKNTCYRGSFILPDNPDFYQHVLFTYLNEDTDYVNLQVALEVAQEYGVSFDFHGDELEHSEEISQGELMFPVFYLVINNPQQEKEFAEKLKMAKMHYKFLTMLRLI